MEYGCAYSFVGALPNHSGNDSSSTSCSRHVYFFHYIVLVFVPGTFLRVLTTSIILVQLSQESWKKKKEHRAGPTSSTSAAAAAAAAVAAAEAAAAEAPAAEASIIIIIIIISSSSNGSGSSSSSRKAGVRSDSNTRGCEGQASLFRATAKPIHAKTELKHAERGTQHCNNGRPPPVCDPYRPNRKDSLVSVCNSYSLVIHEGSPPQIPCRT